MKHLQSFFILLTATYALIFAFLAVLQVSLGDYGLALVDIACLIIVMLFGTLQYKLIGFYRSKEKR